MNNDCLCTTVVGSYPIQINTVHLMKQYFSMQQHSWNTIIQEAINDMISAGIQIISDGQTRDPFIQLFTRKLHGCRVRDRTEIIDEIEYGSPITVEDQRFIKKQLPTNIQLKGVLTGPFTLMNACIDSYYHNSREVAFAFAKALNTEAKNLVPYVDFISIDEPFFSNEMPDYAKELIKTVTDGVTCPITLHICGDISAEVSQIIDLPVDILSHEFKATSKLIDVFSDYSFPQHICLGAVRSDINQIESVDEIVEHIQKAIKIFGEKLIHIAPDCGQRLLPREVAYKKLQNLVLAGRQFNG